MAICMQTRGLYPLKKTLNKYIYLIFQPYWSRVCCSLDGESHTPAHTQTSFTPVLLKAGAAAKAHISHHVVLDQVV